MFHKVESSIQKAHVRSFKDAVRGIMLAVGSAAATAAAVVALSAPPADATTHHRHTKADVCNVSTLKNIFSEVAASAMSQGSAIPFYYKVSVAQPGSNGTYELLNGRITFSKSAKFNSSSDDTTGFQLNSTSQLPSAFKGAMTGNFTYIMSEWPHIGAIVHERGYVVLDGTRCNFSYEGNTYNTSADITASIGAMVGAGIVAALAVMTWTTLTSIAYGSERETKRKGSRAQNPIREERTAEQVEKERQESLAHLEEQAARDARGNNV